MRIPLTKRRPHLQPLSIFYLLEMMSPVEGSISIAQ